MIHQYTMRCEQQNIESSPYTEDAYKIRFHSMSTKFCYLLSIYARVSISMFVFRCMSAITRASRQGGDVTSRYQSHFETYAQRRDTTRTRDTEFDIGSGWGPEMMISSASALTEP